MFYLIHSFRKLFSNDKNQIPTTKFTKLETQPNCKKLPQLKILGIIPAWYRVMQKHFKPNFPSY